MISTFVRWRDGASPARQLPLSGMPDNTGSGLDINATVEAIKKGAATGTAVAAARPGWPDLGRVLSVLHAEFVASVWGGTDDRLAQRPLRPLAAAAGASPGTPELNPDNQLVLQVANTSVTAVRDHLLGFANLCASDGPGRTLLAVSRILLDASAHTLWLLDPSIDERARTIRATNLWFESTRQEINDPIAEAQKQTLEDRRDALLRDAVADGFQPVLTKGGKQQHQLTPAYSQNDVLTAALGNRAQAHWRDASSVAHAQERPDLRFALGVGEIDPGPHATSLVMTRAMLAVTHAIRAARTCEHFYGTVGSPVPENSTKRVLAVGGFGSGMHDDIIRRHRKLD